MTADERTAQLVTEPVAGQVVGETVNGTAFYNLDDDTLRWTPEWRLSDSEYAEARVAGFKWWRGSQAWVATWTPTREDFLLQHVSEVTHEADPDNPDARIERFVSRASAAAARSGQRASAAMRNLPPMGEPVKLDHHSARRHLRAVERSDQNMRRAFEEDKKAQYWRDRARGAERRARQKSDPGVIRRRIDRLETDLRQQQRVLDRAPSNAYAQRWAAHLELRLTFERARLESLALPPFAPVTAYKAGDVVKTKRYGKCEVIRIGPKNIRVAELAGPTKGWTWLVPPHDLEPWPEGEASTTVDH